MGHTQGHAQGAWGGMHRGHGAWGMHDRHLYPPELPLSRLYSPPSPLIRPIKPHQEHPLIHPLIDPCRSTPALRLPDHHQCDSGVQARWLWGEQGGMQGAQGGVQQRTSEVSVGTSEGLIRCVECLGTPRAHAGGTGSCWAHAGQPRVVHGLAASPPPASCPLLPAPPPGPVL